MAALDMLDVLTRDKRRLVAVRAVADGNATLAQAEDLWRKPLFRLSHGPHARQSLSLQDIIDRHRRAILIDGGDGPRPVETIFTSVLFVTPETIADPAADRKSVV